LDKRALLEHLEASLGDSGDEAVLAGLAFLAAQAVHLPEAVLRAALRRAMLLLAAGGDPHRGLEPDGRAVRALARDLDAPEYRSELAAALDRLHAEAAGLEGVTRALDNLRSDGDLAWRWLACAFLAAEIADEGGA
jgi:hypothetical protein